MKKVILKLTKFSLLFLVLLGSTILLTTNYIFNKSNFKIPNHTDKIIIGHSHAECAYNDSLIVNTINIAQSGESYFYSYYKINQLLQQNEKIKYVFLEFTNNEIGKKMDDWIWSGLFLSHRYHLYAPFIDYQGHNLLIKKNAKNLLKLQVKTLLNNVKTIVLSEYNYVRKTGGYLYLVRNKTDSLVKLKDTATISNKIPELPIENLAYLDRIVLLCKIKKVKLVLLRSPLHKKYKGIHNEKEFQNLLATKYQNTHFLDFKNFPLTDDEFGDLEHLNFKGAKKFSVFFNDLLAQNLLSAPDQQKIIDTKISLLN
ncbi:hypothetical protein OQX61_02580 [Pedobacter sp. PLR]|uniref:hypothetical protein n=1 Tax=Pedobacter sp. PLR TaxID=2994465 RepID=UPI002247D279|nr:hypothetical protein [Pedobacter sp. PLR]MCX2450146.1 hypothetical protein [Pedobacter sp. PLR]